METDIDLLMEYFPDRESNLTGFFETREILLNRANKSLVTEDVPLETPLLIKDDIIFKNKVLLNSNDTHFKELLYKYYDNNSNKRLKLCKSSYSIVDTKIKSGKKSIKIQNFYSVFDMLLDNYYLKISISIENKRHILYEKIFEYNSYIILAKLSNCINLDIISGICNYIEIDLSLNKNTLKGTYSFKYNIKDITNYINNSNNIEIIKGELVESVKHIIEKIQSNKSTNIDIKYDICRSFRKYLVIVLTYSL